MCQKNKLNGNLFYELINASKLKRGLVYSDYILHLLTIFYCSWAFFEMLRRLQTQMNIEVQGTFLNKALTVALNQCSVKSKSLWLYRSSPRSENV